MAYEPTEWQAGDTITSARLNKIEQGIAGGGGAFIVDIVADGNDYALSATGQEILDALHEGKTVMAHDIVTSSTKENYIALSYATADDTAITISLDSSIFTGALSGHPAQSGK